MRPALWHGGFGCVGIFIHAGFCCRWGQMPLFFSSLWLYIDYSLLFDWNKHVSQTILLCKHIGYKKNAKTFMWVVFYHRTGPLQHLQPHMHKSGWSTPASDNTLRFRHGFDSIWVKSRYIIDSSASIILEYFCKRCIQVVVSASLKIVCTMK